MVEERKTGPEEREVLDLVGREPVQGARDRAVFDLDDWHDGPYIGPDGQHVCFFMSDSVTLRHPGGTTLPHSQTWPVAHHEVPTPDIEYTQFVPHLLYV
jgi:hypothetical protein